MSNAASVVDFDHHSQHYADNWMEIYADLRERCPVARTEAHGGYWVISRYEDVARVALDDDTFASHHDTTGECPHMLGVAIPPGPLQQVPIELDDPEFSQYRKILNPHLSPKASKTWVPFFEQTSNAVLDLVCESGRMDLVLDYGNPVPAIWTLKFLGLPMDEWEKWATPFHEIAYLNGSDQTERVVMDLFNRMVELNTYIPGKRESPDDGLLSFLANEARVGDAPLTDQRILDIAFLMFIGGVDTTTALVSGALVWLQRNPEIRKRVTDNLDLLPSACEEFLRYISSSQALARTVTRDVELGGQQLHEGDRVLLSWASANHDPSVFEDPEVVDIERFPNKHQAFGLGKHRCLGSNIARLEFVSMMSVFLTRMADYSIDLDAAERYTSVGQVNGWVSLPATFTPSKPRGIALPH